MANEPRDVLEPLINEATLAEWLRCRPSALRRLREQRKGPAFVMVGRWAMYRRIDIERWLDRESAANVAPAGTEGEAASPPRNCES
jgi:hypothetical protein